MGAAEAPVGRGTVMPGNLHIFRLQANPPQYQLNYNVGAHSWVQVFTPEGKFVKEAFYARKIVL